MLNESESIKNTSSNLSFDEKFARESGDSDLNQEKFENSNDEETEGSSGHNEETEESYLPALVLVPEV